MPKLMDILGENFRMNTDDSKKDEDTTKEDEVRVTGKVIKVSKNGYGFLSSKDIPFTRIFFHWTSLKPGKVKFMDLKNGIKVSFVAFELEGKGYRAIKVKVEDE